MIRTILVLLNLRDHVSTLALAADLACHFRAHIEVVHVTVGEDWSSPDAVETPLSGRHEERRIPDQPAAGADPQQIFRDWRAAHGFREPPDRLHRGLASASFSELTGWPAVELPRRAQFADLICLALPVAEELDGTSDLIEAVLFGSGRPVLMVPIRERYTPGSLLGARAVVGWNGSLEAVRAVSAALPFLEVSARVEIITIDEEAGGAADAYEMATYLAFHGIAATASGIGRKDWSGGDVIDVAVDRAAGLLVMGARRHSGPRALGSATRHIFGTKPLPVLMVA